jgi:hypothetical protein
MSDHDRGAYTPQTDPPLAFDPRRPSKRRPLPMALIGSAVVLVVLLAGVAMVYHGGVREAGQSPRPVGEPVMAVKTAPLASTTQSSTTTTATDAYSPVNQTAEAPKLAPAPEQPTARPPPSPATVALLSKPPAPNHIERPAPVTAAPTPPKATPPKIDETELAAASGGARSSHIPTSAAAPVARTSATTTTAPAPTKPAKASKPVQLAEASPPKVAPAIAAPATGAATAGASGSAVVQIGAFSSTALAEQGYANVAAALPDRMSGKAKHVLALSKDGGTLYRTWLSGFANRADAVSFCEALKAKGQTCFVKGG